MKYLGSRNFDGKKWDYWRTGDEESCSMNEKFFRAVISENIVPGGRIFSDSYKFSNREECLSELKTG